VPSVLLPSVSKLDFEVHDEAFSIELETCAEYHDVISLVVFFR
jgi:hypothetical protein